MLSLLVFLAIVIFSTYYAHTINTKTIKTIKTKSTKKQTEIEDAIKRVDNISASKTQDSDSISKLGQGEIVSDAVAAAALAKRASTAEATKAAGGSGLGPQAVTKPISYTVEELPDLPGATTTTDTPTDDASDGTTGDASDGTTDASVPGPDSGVDPVNEPTPSPNPGSSDPARRRKSLFPYKPKSSNKVYKPAPEFTTEDKENENKKQETYRFNDHKALKIFSRLHDHGQFTKY